MKPSGTYIRQKFDEFNKLCFGGQLPPIRIVMTEAKTYLGKVSYRTVRRPDGSTVNSAFTLRINTRIDLPQDEVDDTILHEMIHYYIAVNNRKDDAPHGTLFKQMMNHLNTRYNRHITISHRNTAAQQEQAIDSRPVWHVIAVVNFTDGRTGIKVLPRVLERILHYYNQVSSQPQVKKVELYFSNNPYFNRYPNSARLAAHFVNIDEVKPLLHEKEKIGCDGKRLILPH